MRPHGPRSLNFLALVVAIPALASAADISWVNPSGGNWSNPANWSASALPGPGDNVFLILPGAYAVTQDVHVTVGSLTLGDGTGPTNLHQMMRVPCGEGRYQVRFTTDPDVAYTIQASVHLTNDWVALCTTNPTAGVIDWIDADAPLYPRRFYRARTAP